jgi:hypothetical protein
LTRFGGHPRSVKMGVEEVPHVEDGNEEAYVLALPRPETVGLVV